MSLDPLLLLWSVDNAVGCATEFVLGSGFAVHLLGAHQFDAAVTFATKGQDRFAQHEWSWSQRGLPILAGSAAVFECELDRAVAAGDHTLLIGRVLDVVHTDHDALLYHRRAFHSTIQMEAMP